MTQLSTVEPLTPASLRHVCTLDHFQFQTTADLQTSRSIIGQPRGSRSIEFGIGIASPGYNIYVAGEAGTGRTTTIRRFLEERAAGQPTPSDWIYVHNFAVPHQPKAIALPSGEGVTFRTQMEKLLGHLKQDLPKAFASDAYEEALETIRAEYERRREEELGALRHEAASQECALVNTASGLTIAPVEEGRVMPGEIFDALPLAEQEAIQTKLEPLRERLEEVMDHLRDLDIALRDEVRELNHRVAATSVEHYFSQLRDLYEQHQVVLDYLSEVRNDVLDSLDDFAPADDQEEHNEPDLRRYQVNLLVDNSKIQGAPVIVEPNPSYHNLVGRMEYELQYGLMSTHFSNLKAGSLHRANGGYLVINARDILRYSDAWQALKRSIVSSAIQLQSPDSLDGSQALAKSLDPEPIPLSLKVVLLGSPDLYYALYDQEEDFGQLFKVKADFDTVMPRDEAHEHEYASFIASRCQEEGLRHFDRQAVEKIVEYGSRLCGDQYKLSTRFGEVADLIREANYWAGQRDVPTVASEDVQAALAERRFRANLLEERLRDEIGEGTLFIDTRGEVIGQVNSLTVLDMGDYQFGTPSRITARTYMGEAGVVNIEREVDLAGPLHNKGLLTLTGFLGGNYAGKQPFSLSASLTFEQNYSNIDGDSASVAELYALLSSLSGIPLKQGIAVTGSVNQRGQIQPIGAATEKIEGFYDACEKQGLTGEQGVIIPAANTRHLMLREDVVAAVAGGRFHIWAIDTVDQGLELITGRPSGQPDEDGQFPQDSVHRAVQQRLFSLAKELKHFGDRDDEDED